MKISCTCVHEYDYGTAVRMYAGFKPHLNSGQTETSLKSVPDFRGVENRKQASIFMRIVCVPALLDIAHGIYEFA